MVMPTLFGERHIKIEGNPLLEGIANHILDLVQRNPELLNGKKIGDIDKNITLALWYDEGFGRFVPEDKRGEFEKWFMEHCPDEEAISRARRYLAERDFIRLPQSAVQTAERHRQRISRSVR